MHPEALFKIGNSGIYAYGICMAAGIIMCFVFLYVTMWIKKFNEEATDKILVIGVVGTGFGIFTATLFQSVYNFIADPEGGFHFGGMTFIGGLIGGVLSFLVVYWVYIYLIAPRTKIKLLKNNMNATLTDALPFIPIGIVIAHAFGRLGCFFGGCCYGKPAPEGVWGLPCSAPYGHQLDVLVIPTQLYECLFLVALAIIMCVLYFKFSFYANFGLYAVVYGIWRFGIEFVRGDARGELLPGVSLFPSQIWSIVMVFAGIGYFFLERFVFSKHMKHPERQKAQKEQTKEAEAK